MQKTHPSSEKALLLIQFLIGLIWFKSALAKFTGGAFVSSLAKTLTFFASKNPTFYKGFIENVALPHSVIFAQLTRFGELTAGIFLAFTALGFIIKKIPQRAAYLALIGAVTGFFLNLNFGLAAYWTSPATETVNLLMAGIEIILVGFWAFSIKKSV